MIMKLHHRLNTYFIFAAAICLISGCADLHSQSENYTSCGPTTLCNVEELCCNGQCVPPSDVHCGKCDNVCDINETCYIPKAGTDSSYEYIATDAFCLCGTLSTGGVDCSESCCPINDSNGAAVCVDLAETLEHCGTCGSVCGAGRKCEDGQCVCTNGLSECEGECIVLTSTENCGACGTSCPDASNSNLNLEKSRCGFDAFLQRYSCMLTCKDGYANDNQNINDGCETKLETIICGNGIIDAGELCDGNAVGTMTCKDADPSFTGGALKCKYDCLSFDTSGCEILDSGQTGNQCNNGQLDDGEICDGTKFRGSPDCATYSAEIPTTDKYVSGNLSCTDKCTLDFSDCMTASCEEGAFRCTGHILETCQDYAWVQSQTCTGITPVCDANAQKCVGCQSDTNCGTKKCHPQKQECVACLSDADCGQNKCDTTKNTCVTDTPPTPGGDNYDVTETMKDFKGTAYASENLTDYGSAGTIKVIAYIRVSDEHIIDERTAVLRGETSSIVISNMTSGLGTLSFDYKTWNEKEGNQTLNITVGSEVRTLDITNDDTTAQNKSFVFNDKTATSVEIKHASGTKRVSIDNVRWTSAN